VPPDLATFDGRTSRARHVLLARDPDLVRAMVEWFQAALGEIRSALRPKLMKAESIVFAVAGMCFGVILGWVIGLSRQDDASPRSRRDAAPRPRRAGNPRQPPPLDEAKVQSLSTILKSDPKNAGAAVQLANTYFDAEQYPTRSSGTNRRCCSIRTIPMRALTSA
jgi:hypothetical protein